MTPRFYMDHRGPRLLLFIALCLAFLWAQSQTTVINNGKLRFGNGSQNSVNNSGNLNQPFYFNGVMNTWRKLTYSSNPLNFSIAVGGDGTSDWNTNGNLVSDIALMNKVIDTDDFTYDSGSSGTGRGIIVSTGELSVNGQLLEMENTYTIENSAFITIRVKIKNVSGTPVQNLRYWIGTRDDYVGGTDRPRKERGNLVDGSFVQVPSADTRAAAVKISTSSEGVLFFSNSNRAYSIIDRCCSWSSVYSQDPNTSDTDVTNDGSYGFYVRMNDLAPNESDEFEWYYAAAELDDLEDVINEVADAAGSVNEITCNSADFEVEASTDGNGYYVVVPDGSAAPTDAEIEAGVDYGGVTVVTAGSASLTADVPFTFDIQGLTASTDYDIYFVVKDISNVYLPIVSTGFLTAGLPIMTFTVVDANCGDSEDGTAEVVASGGTAPYSYTWDDGSISALRSGLNPGTYVVDVADANGCASQGQAVVGSDDITSPQAIAQNITMYFDAAGSVAITSADVDGGSNDNCGSVALTVFPETADCSDIGAINVTLTADDGAGNTDVTTATVTLVDSTSPQVLTSNIIRFLDANGQVTIIPDEVDAGSTDNCSISSMQLDKAEFDCSDLGVNQVELTVTDASANSRLATAEVIIRDDLAPSLTVQDRTFSLGSVPVDISAEDLILTEDDNCAIMTRSLDIDSFDCDEVGVHTVTVTVFDIAGNQTSATSSVTIEEAVTPTIQVQGITLALDVNGQASVEDEDVFGLFDAGSEDNCAIDPGSASISRNQFDCDDLGSRSVIYSLEDVHGNSGDLATTIQVIDDMAPVVQTQNITIDLDASGQASLSVGQVDNGSTDNCGIESLSLSLESFDCGRLGANSVTLTAVDGSGNTGTQELTVTVRDLIPAVVELVPSYTISLDEEGYAEITAQDLIASASDNCSIASRAVLPFSFDCEDKGLNEVTVTVIDGSGNETILTMNILVVDDTAPTMALESFDLSLDELGEADLRTADIMPFVSDNCGSVTVSIANGYYGCSDLDDPTPASITLVDIDGNTSVFELDVQLADLMHPTVEVQDVTLILDANGRAGYAMSELTVDVWDNCSIAEEEVAQNAFDCSHIGTNEVVFSVTDASGNQTEAIFEVDVIDNISPSFMTPVRYEQCAGRLEIEMPEVTDACPASVSIVDGPLPGEEVLAGTYELTFMAIDETGNASMRIVELLVHEEPVVDLGPDLTVVPGEQLTFDMSDLGMDIYEWTDGSTGPDLEVTVQEEMTIGLSAGMLPACLGYDEVNIFIDSTSDVLDLGTSGLIKVFPNPTDEVLYLSLEGLTLKETMRLIIMDTAGKKVLEQEIDKQGAEIVPLDVTNLSKGIYHIHLLHGDMDSSLRFVKR